VNLASLLKVRSEDAKTIGLALAHRRSMASEDRREFDPPKVAGASLRAAFLWSLGVIRQDNPVLLWVGLGAAATNLLYLLASGVVTMLR